jgi:retinol dehydrogenase 12
LILPVPHALQGNILFSNELARRYGDKGIVSISLNPGTNLSRSAGSAVNRLIQLVKYGIYYMVSCGELSFLPKDGSPSSNVSHGAITSLYAGTADSKDDLNGKVGVPALSIAHTSPTYV